MSQGTEFCAILSIRYLNPLLMGSAHDWVNDNMPPMPEGVIRMRNFHIAPDRGMTIIWFDNQEHLEFAFPHLKAFQQQIAERFEGRVEAQKGITSPELDFGA
jgi:hypothetical protein